MDAANIQDQASKLATKAAELSNEAEKLVQSTTHLIDVQAAARVRTPRMAGQCWSRTAQMLKDSPMVKWNQYVCLFSMSKNHFRETYNTLYLPYLSRRANSYCNLFCKVPEDDP